MDKPTSKHACAWLMLLIRLIKRPFRKWLCSYANKWGWYQSIDLPFQFWIELGGSHDGKEYYFHFNQIYNVAPEHQAILGMTDNRNLIQWEINKGVVTLWWVGQKP